MKNTHSCETESLRLLARFDFLDVCLLGETGTGKTHTARQIHDLSPRAKGAFVAINCAELSASLVESELFGYEKGAFTGAVTAKTGKFEAAAGGTIFLDEIGELPESLQAKLLKVIEEKSITRVGGTRPRSVDVRIIYATHRDLSILREDLRYRVAAAYAIHLKPLRQRTEEIVPLARLFLSELSSKFGRVFRASDDTLKLLESSEWRGNVRELQTFVEKACFGALLVAENESRTNQTIELTGELLLSRLSSAAAPPQRASFPPISGCFPTFAPGEKIEEYLGKIEAYLLQKAMEANNYNQTHAARELGLSRGGLINKLKRMSH